VTNNRQSTIAIIPARGGSKRIPRKNIREFCGKPMIAWSIEAIRKAGVFDAVVVSTDDEEIATVAQSLGAEAPFRRPPELSNDHAATLPVVAHAIRWWEENRGPLEYCCCVYATAPFLKPDFLRKGLEMLQTKPDAEFAFTVTSYAFPIFRALQINTSGQVEMFWPENHLKRSQDLPEAWHDAGQFYWGQRDAFLGDKGFFRSNSYPVVLPRHLVQDIDTPEDWERAERMFAARA
jgi:N-acylneuraminate cytidylyltransferase